MAVMRQMQNPQLLHLVMQSQAQKSSGDIWAAARLMKCYFERLEPVKSDVLFIAPNQKGRPHFLITLKVMLPLHMLATRFAFALYCVVSDFSEWSHVFNTHVLFLFQIYGQENELTHCLVKGNHTFSSLFKFLCPII